jgi:hypothetical protein
MWFWQQYRPAGELTEVLRTCDRYGCRTTKNKGVMSRTSR